MQKSQEEKEKLTLQIISVVSYRVRLEYVEAFQLKTHDFVPILSRTEEEEGIPGPCAMHIAKQPLRRLVPSSPPNYIKDSINSRDYLIGPQDHHDMKEMPRNQSLSN